MAQQKDTPLRAFSVSSLGCPAALVIIDYRLIKCKEDMKHYSTASAPCPLECPYMPFIAPLTAFNLICCILTHAEYKNAL